MKLGKKSHVISAYAALFTVAIGLILWDYVRRVPALDEPQAAQVQKAPAGSALVAR